MSDLVTRVVSGVVAAVLFIVIMLLPNPVFEIAFVLLIGGLTFETVRAFKLDVPFRIISCVGAMAIGVLSIFYPNYLLLGIFAFLVLILGVTLALPERYNIRDIVVALFSIMYVCIFPSFLPRVLTMWSAGKWLILFVFIGAWLSDIGAFFAGRAFGKHKLIEKVSPKKTVEGSIGGILAAILFSLLYAFGLQKFAGMAPHYGVIALFAFLASILGQMGDLLASMIKRYCGIKDFGKIMPGHGGLFDRCDSIILIAPLLYYFTCIFGNFLA